MVNNLQIGLNGRFFPNNWRPALEEITFAAACGFRTIQFPGKEEGLGATHLGAELPVVRQALLENRLVAVMEIIVRVDSQGVTVSGRNPLQVLEANLPAISGLGCACVHFHFVPLASVADGAMTDLEARLLPYLAEGASLGQQNDFRFGFEHNEPSVGLFSTPLVCAEALAAIPALSFVWDLNHTSPQDVEGFATLIPRLSMLHVSDTLWPETNYHLPLGLGNLDFSAYCRRLRQGNFSGPAILEIGGLPKSGGYGRDTDEALRQSLQYLEEANSAAYLIQPATPE